MEKIIIISSNDKDNASSNSNSDFVVNLKERYNTQNIKHVLIKEVQVCNCFYNVRSGTNGEQNNQFKMQETGEPDILFTIAEGQYTTATYITALQAAMNTALVVGSVAITQDPINQKLIFTFTGITAIFYNLADGNLMAPVAGITVTTAAPAALINSDSLPNLSGVNMVYFHSREVGENHGINGDFGLINVVESLSFHDVPFGAYGYKQNNDDELALIQYDQPRNLNRISVTLRDDLGNKLDIGTTELTLTIKAFFA